MDQTIIVGIGNIYSDEILWRAKINPFREKIGDRSAHYCPRCQKI